jgi:hypothetical protein
MNLTHLSESEAVKTLRRMEKDRKRLIKDYFKKDISDPHLFDAVWSTDKVPIEAIATTLIPLIRYRTDQFH